MLAKDIMRKHVVTVGPEMTLHELAELLVDNHITGTPVVARDGVLLGVISQTDLVRHEREENTHASVPSYYQDEAVLPKGFQIEAPDYTRVRDWMTPMVISAREGDSIVQLAKTMLNHKIHRIIVTNGGKLKGIITSIDLVRALLQMVEANGKKAPAERAL